MKRDWLIYLVIFSLALNLGTIGTFAYLRYQDQREKAVTQGPPPPTPLRALGRELNLDRSQRQALRDLFPEHRRKVTQIREALINKRQEFFDLIKEDSTPWSAIQAKIQEISALQGGLEEEMTRYLLALKRKLNPQQQAAFLSKLQGRLCGPEGACGPLEPGFGGHHRPHRGHGMGPGMGPGPPPLEDPR